MGESSVFAISDSVYPSDGVIRNAWAATRGGREHAAELVPEVWPLMRIEQVLGRTGRKIAVLVCGRGTCGRALHRSVRRARQQWEI